MKLFRAKELERSSRSGRMSDQAKAERAGTKWIDNQILDIFLGLDLTVDEKLVIGKRIEAALRRALGIGL